MSDPVLRLLFFILLVPFNWMGFHWLWDLICESAGVSKREVWEFRAKVRFQPHPNKHLMYFLLNKSRKPGKYKVWVSPFYRLRSRTGRLMLLYELGNLPMFLCIGLSVTGLFAPGFDRALGYAAVLQPCIIAVAAAAGIWNHFMRKKRGTLPENRESWRDGFRYWAQALFKEELEPYKKAGGGNLAKTILFSVGKLAIAIGIMVGFFLLIVHL